MDQPPTPLNAKCTRDAINKKAISSDNAIKDLGRRTVTGGVIAVVAQAVRMIVMLATIAILARLLKPSDFGLIGMAATVTAFVAIFSDLGLSTATVQRKEIDQGTISALFYINVVIGIALMVVAIIVAPLAGMFFGDDRVSLLIVAQSITFPLVAAAAQHNALLQRSMRWMELQAISVTSQLAGAVVAITFASQTSAGVWSIVAQNLVAAILGTIAAWTLCEWRPTATRQWGSAHSALKFGLNLTGFNLLNYFHRQFDNALIGWQWGAQELGYYTRAYGLFLLPLTGFTWPASSVVIPAMCRLQAEPSRWAELYLTSIAVITLVTAPISGVLFLNAHLIITLLLGDAWQPAVPIFQILSLSILIQPIYTSGGWIFVSLGRASEKLKAGIFATIWYLAAYTIGVRNGGMGVAIAYTVAVYLLVPVWLWWATRDTPLGLSIIGAVIWPQILAAMGGVAGCFLVGVTNPRTFAESAEATIVFMTLFTLLLCPAVALSRGTRAALVPARRKVIQMFGELRS